MYMNMHMYVAHTETYHDQFQNPHNYVDQENNN